MYKGINGCMYNCSDNCTGECMKSMDESIDKKEKTEPVPLETGTLDHGYCYIGKSNNVRNCAKVSSKNKCMSGDIFPTMDLCINPNLRN